MDKPVYNLATGIKQHDMHREYGAFVKLGLVMDASELRFLLQDLRRRSSEPIVSCSSILIFPGSCRSSESICREAAAISCSDSIVGNPHGHASATSPSHPRVRSINSFLLDRSQV